MSQQEVDRYVSFQGTDCDRKACSIVNYIEQYVENPPHKNPWLKYFQDALDKRASLGQDPLFLVCSQMNNIRSLFEEYEDENALELLEDIEENCC